MHRIDTPTAQKDKFGAGKNGFTNGDATAGIRATQLIDTYWDSVQEELCAVIEAAGLKLEKTKNTQLLEAIRGILNKKVSDDALLKANNLSDVVNKAAALQNLGVINAVYPVGIVAWFAQNKNPNTLFPGTTWKYIGENRTVRLASANGSDVMTTGGADSVALTANNLPPHAHTFSGSTSAFDYGTKATTSFDYGTKATTSFDYGTKTTSTGGDHAHAYTANRQQSGGSTWIDVFTAQSNQGNQAKTIPNAGAHNHTVALGAHTHNVALGAHTHNVALGAHTHTFSGTTTNTGGGVAVNMTNSFIKLMGWYRES